MLLTALQMIGEKPVGGTLTANEQTEYLSRLNMWLELQANDGLICFATDTVSKVLIAGDGIYTIGSGGDINVAWPTKIESAYTIDGANVSRDIPNIVTNDEWAQISLKQLGNMYPDTLWYDNSYPLGSVYLWPLPMGGLTLYMNVYQRLQSFPLISTVVSMPPGYEIMIVSNMAVFLSAGLCDPPEHVVKLAEKSMATIKKKNLQVPTLDIPPGLTADNSAFYQFPIPQW